MTFFDWLASPSGVDLVHAVIVLLLAAASYFSFLSHRAAAENNKRIDVQSSQIEEIHNQLTDHANGHKM